MYGGKITIKEFTQSAIDTKWWECLEKEILAIKNPFIFKTCYRKVTYNYLKIIEGCFFGILPPPIFKSM